MSASPTCLWKAGRRRAPSASDRIHLRPRPETAVFGSFCPGVLPWSTLEHSDARTWTGERLVSFTCPLGEVTTRLPTVARQPFRVPERTGDDVTDEEFARALSAAAMHDQPEGGRTFSGAAGAYQDNPYLDTIVRLPSCGIGSRHTARYCLETLSARAVCRGTHRSSGCRSRRARTWRTGNTICDERLAYGPWEPRTLSIHLPPKFRLHIGDAELDLTIECFNSVERSWALRVAMGWIRGICGNGLFFGNVTASIRRSHAAGLSVEDIPAVIGRGFSRSRRPRSRAGRRVPE